MANEQAYKSGIIAVTGASRGLGAAISLALLRNGFCVACLSRTGNEPRGIDDESTLRERLITIACDVCDDVSLAACFKSLSKRDGGLRALINNAGIHASGASARFRTIDFEALLRTNTIAVFSASREAYPYLKQAGGTAIINIGSFMERIGAAHNACYSASKAAVGALTRSLAVEWARDQIAVLNVAPGYVETDLNTDYLTRDDVKAYFARQTPIGRPALPEEVGRLIANLLNSDLTLLTGQTISADGGHSIAHGNIK